MSSSTFDGSCGCRRAWGCGFLHILWGTFIYPGQTDRAFSCLLHFPQPDLEAVHDPALTRGIWQDFVDEGPVHLPGLGYWGPQPALVIDWKPYIGCRLELNEGLPDSLK